MFEWASPTGKLSVGDQIQLKSVNGEITGAIINGISHCKPIKPTKRNNYGITLKPPLDYQEFERDTEIWVVVPRETKEKPPEIAAKSD
jgi:hypothetical protein